MTKLTCSNCGAPLGGDFYCDYCGTQYRQDINGAEIKFIEGDGVLGTQMLKALLRWQMSLIKDVG